MATKEELLLKMQQNGEAAAAKTPAQEAAIWTERWKDAAEKIATRPDFSYNPNSDPVYQNYREQYMRNGRMAMEDTMGKAAANNGGYGTSYGQMAGQQAWNGYLQGLNDQYPQLYQAALSRYQQAGEQLQTKMTLADSMRAAVLAGQGGGGRGRSTAPDSTAAALLALRALNAGGYTETEILKALQEYGYSASQAKTALSNATGMKQMGSALGGAASSIKNAASGWASNVAGAFNSLFKKTEEKKK